jgi:hypothetical protein
LMTASIFFMRTPSPVGGACAEHAPPRPLVPC